MFQSPVGLKGDQASICYMSKLNINKNKKNTSLDKLVTSSHEKNSHKRETYLIQPYEEPLNRTKTSIKSNRRKNLNAKTFGDHLVEKEEGTIRIASQNVNCIGVSTEMNHKQELAKDWIFQHSVDIIGWQETGVAFHTLPMRKRLAHRMKDIRWDKMRISSANNKHENIATFQYGGTSVMAFNAAAHRVKATGADKSGLGRWSWILFEGKHKHYTRVISAYVPCKSTTDRMQTVYNQQKRYFSAKGILECPRKLMHQHLVQNIKEWQRKGENIVLLIDSNENLARMGQLQSLLTYECQLVDPIRSTYQKKDTMLPSTSLTGSNPIDAIFVSSQLRDITRGGWIKVEKSIGDHRALFIDIPIKTLLGEDPFTIHRNTARRLVCEQPKVVNKYNELLKCQLQQQHTYKKFEEFERLHQSNKMNEQSTINTLNKIDNSITNSILYAEKRCRKLKAGKVPYSPELNRVGKEINVWNNVLRKKRGCNISSTYIKRIAKKSDISHPMSLTIEDCIKERQSASRRYKKLKRNAKQNRIQFIEELATQQAERGNESISNAINRINRNEELRESHRRIKMVTKPFCGATEKVLIPTENIAEERITNEKIEIEQALCKQNKKKFTSAYSSPFLQQPLLSQIGQTATSEESQQILLGNFDPPKSLSKDTKRFIKQLKIPSKIQQKGKNDTYCDITTATAYWRKKRERTNSSMSGRHIGTYKALTYGNTTILHMINEISNYSFNIGIPLQRWTKDLDVSLLKKPNKIRPSELRTIGTLEADFNQCASLHFSKRMMDTGITSKSIPSSQYAKKGNRAIEAAIVKVLFFDYIRITKINGAFMAMDLENCFDRMAHPISSLCSQRLGVSSKISQCMINTLCKMKHYMRTAYGDSDWSYSGSSSRPLQGAVQGNGAASPIFIAISCVILAFLESQTTGISIISAITMSIFTLSAIMYVDDADILIAATHKNENYKSIRNRVQKSAKVYKAGVHQTGGAIRPEKCRWYLIAFKWINGIAKYEYSPDIEPVTIEDSNGKEKVVERLDIRKGWKGLGIVASPSGCWKDHMNYLINEKINPWNASIRSSYLQRHDVYRAAFTSIFKSIDYTLPATSLNSSQCNLINAKLHKRYLPRIGIDSHMPLAYRYAPNKYQGLNSLDVQTKQFIEKLKLFLTHAGTQSQLGQSIQLILESIHISAGLNSPIFTLPYSKYNMLIEKGWLQDLWLSAELYDVKIQGSYVTPAINRVNDYALMEKLIQLDMYTDEDIKSINRCRIYLQVQNLSEITNGHGTQISFCAKNYIKDPDRISNYEWPKQPFPSKRDWEAWEDALLNAWSNGNYQIIPSLGEWNHKLSFHSQWKYSATTERVFYKVSTCTYNVYEPESTNRRHSTSYKFLHATTSIPSNATNAIVNRTIPHKPRLEAVLPTETTMKHSNNDIQHHTNTFMNQIRFSNKNIKNLINDIENNVAIAVTDASVSPITSIGATSFVITSSDLQTSCSGSHGVPQGSSSMDSYRAEIYGIYGIMVSLQYLVQHHQIKKGSVLIACDNKAGLYNSLAYNDRASVAQGSFDILWAIQSIKSSLPLEIRYQHVKGHQDKSRRSLTLLETLNCIMDKKAGQYREYIESSTTYEYSKLHYYSNWNCTIKSKHITESLEKNVKDHIHYHKMKEHLVQNKGYTESAFECIDWIAIEKASESLTMTRQIWLTKFVSGFCATGSVMKKRELWDNQLCPICQSCKETTAHVITCTDERSTEQYNKSITKFFKHLERLHTDPTILHIFKLTLSTSTPTSFKNNVPPNEIDAEFIEAAEEQDLIGWENVFKGHITKKWAALQMKHFCRMYQNPPSLHKWSKTIILKLYDVAHEMWTHRNDIVHEKFEENLSKQASEQLKSDVILEYRKGSKQIMSTHKFLFREKLKCLLKKSVMEKQYWLLTAQSSRICFQKCCSPRNQNTSEIILDHAFVPD